MPSIPGRQREAPPGSEELDRRLPSGRHKLPREFIVRSQRDRLLDAIAEVCAEKGYAATTVADVVARAGVSRATFYELFRDREDCFLAAYDTILFKFLRSAFNAYKTEAAWPERIRHGLKAVLEFLAAEPAFARMCIVEVLAAGQAAQDRYLYATQALTTIVDEGRKYYPERAGLPASVSRITVGGIAALVYDEIAAGRIESLPRLLPDMLYSVLVPFTGHEAALAEVERAEPPGTRP